MRTYLEYIQWIRRAIEPAQRLTEVRSVIFGGGTLYVSNLGESMAFSNSRTTLADAILDRMVHDAKN
jgi:hypothetical protein